MSADYPRDLIGYGSTPPHPHWPGNARIALSFVLNYEEGGERNILHGDKESEAFLSEMVAAQPLQGERNMSMESLYEYGSRAGVWRILKLFKEFDIPLTIFAVAMAAQRHPDVIRAMVEAGHEICSHGYRWIDYQYMDEAQEREHMLEAIRILTEITGERPLGWYTGRTGPNTRRLVMEEGGFLYDCDTYDDDLPYWEPNNPTGKAHLVIPYTLDTNDMRFTQVQGFNKGDDFYQYLKDAFDVLYAEGAEAPKMLSIGLHCRLIGRPARLAALKRFIEYAKGHDQVWFTRRVDIARHWQQTHPFPGRRNEHLPNPETFDPEPRRLRQSLRRYLRTFAMGRRKSLRPGPGRIDRPDRRPAPAHERHPVERRSPEPVGPDQRSPGPGRQSRRPGATDRSQHP
ncbi:Uricase (urate oxidase) [Pseudomonas chlororaphis subsp. aurantiaca]|nr:Uricase (urate oxidase) [Pseudomonas chlororaphis subsp. aurantiaca]